MAPTFLVTGATGFQGGSTARILLSQGYQVHAFVRNPSSPASQTLASLGAKLFKGTYTDLPSITAATRGVTGIFLNTFPNFTNPRGEIPQAENFIAAAKAAGTVTTIVVSTVSKTKEYLEVLESKPEQYKFLTLYHKSKSGVEDAVLGSGIENITILRPGWLCYQYLAPMCALHFPEYEKEHVLTVSYDKSYKKGHFDPEDVGKFAAAALVQPEKFKGRTIELVHERLSFDEIAGVIGRVAGVDVGVRYRSQEETGEMVKGGKFPVLEMQTIAREIEFVVEGSSLEEYGIELGGLEGFLMRHRERLLETLGVKA